MICNLALCFVLYYVLRYYVFPLIVILINFYIRTYFEKYIKIIQRSGEWAVVTGATDGIGREYCRQLAKLGMKICLISRDRKKLEATSKEIQQYYSVEVKCFKADFTSNSIYDDLNQFLKDLDIGVLVNNVGMTQKYPCYFHELDENVSFLSDFFHCNILSHVAMTKIILPGMCARKRGVVINISSASSMIQIPMAALYASSKKFLSNFSVTINEELRNSGVLIQTVRPSYVRTKFIGNFQPTIVRLPTAEEYVKSAIQTVGIETDTFGTVNHSVQGMMLYGIPQFFWLKFFDFLNKIRRKQLKE